MTAGTCQVIGLWDALRPPDGHGRVRLPSDPRQSSSSYHWVSLDRLVGGGRPIRSGRAFAGKAGGSFTRGSAEPSPHGLDVIGPGRRRATDSSPGVLLIAVRGARSAAAGSRPCSGADGIVEHCSRPAPAVGTARLTSAGGRLLDRLTVDAAGSGDGRLGSMHLAAVRLPYVFRPAWCSNAWRSRRGRCSPICEQSRSTLGCIVQIVDCLLFKTRFTVVDRSFSLSCSGRHRLFFICVQGDPGVVY